MGGEASAFFKVWKAFSQSGVHLNFVSFFKSAFNGLAILAYDLINFL